MNIRRLLWILAALVIAHVAQAQVPGRYVGTVKVEWLPDGRKMRLLDLFAYVDPSGMQWDTPAGWVVDGASIPQPAWSYIGGPFEGKYREASVIHDVACDQKSQAWEDVHEVFYNAMRTSGVETWRAKIMYAAVYHFGPRWPRQVQVPNLKVSQESLAKLQALKGAAPGALAEIVSVVPRTRTASEVATNQPAKADFEVRVLPPKPRMTEAEFETLKRAITAREPSAAGGFSLEEIRNYEPPKP